MTKNLHAAKEALRRSRVALRKGNKDSAHRWAEKAASLAPKLEEPWLLLAATSRPQLSIHYLERALAINPQSKHAQKGMVWAKKRLAPPPPPPLAPPQMDEESVPSPAFGRGRRVRRGEAKGGGGILQIHSQNIGETQPITTISPSKKQRSWRQSLPALLLTILIVSAIWASLPRITSFAANLKATPTATFSQEHWGEADINKPTYTPTPTPTFTPTLTPTPTFTPTYTPVPTKTPRPANTAVPASPQNQIVAGKKYILVDISEQHLYAYQGNTLIYSFVASTGMNNATATGHFSVLNKIPSAYGSTWDIWMPYWLGIYWAGTMQNGIHALPIMSNGVTLWAGYLGTPISYGCIVLGSYEAQLLYNWVNIGTPVDIQW